MTAHRFPIRVYYEDTDAAGIVYYANYLKFAERARTEWLREAGISQSELLKGRHPERSEGSALTSRDPSPSAQDDGSLGKGTGFVVRKVTAEFFAPARLDDLLTVESEVTDIRKVRFSMRQTILRGAERLALLEVDIACVDGKSKPTALTEEIKKLLGSG